MKNCSVRKVRKRFEVFTAEVEIHHGDGAVGQFASGSHDVGNFFGAAHLIGFANLDNIAVVGDGVDGVRQKA